MCAIDPGLGRTPLRECRLVPLDPESPSEPSRLGPLAAFLALALIAHVRSAVAAEEAGAPLPPPGADASEGPPAELPLATLLELPLEELVRVRVTTPSGRPQAVHEAPATTYVVTEEEIRLYGYRNLKDVLRNVPGIEYSDAQSSLFGGQRGF